jgi:formyltetrahydrofolate deformylase
MSCADRPGIVASVASFLHRSGANIVRSDQYSTGPTSGQFFLRIEFHLPGVAARIPKIEHQFADKVASALGALAGAQG